MQVSKAVKQKLPAGPQALIQWAKQNNYDPVTSYTNTAVANIFHVCVREAGTYIDYMDILRVYCMYHGVQISENTLKIWENKKRKCAAS